ncbi:hypothetical protein BKA57DRAFT_217039 [Linnemannia elongata]|nr:hypothetical protein BKA57DRAFT_217039 [Linnemannia elongata]
MLNGYSCIYTRKHLICSSFTVRASRLPPPMLLLILAFLSSFFPPFQSPLACLICSPLARVPNHRHGECGPSPLSILRILELVFPNMSHFLFGKGLDTALMYSRAQFVVTRSIQSPPLFSLFSSLINRKQVTTQLNPPMREKMHASDKTRV